MFGLISNQIAQRPAKPTLRRRCLFLCKVFGPSSLADNYLGRHFSLFAASAGAAKVAESEPTRCLSIEGGSSVRQDTAPTIQWSPTNRHGVLERDARRQSRPGLRHLWQGSSRPSASRLQQPADQRSWTAMQNFFQELFA
jgi:hypothetical protein